MVKLALEVLYVLIPIEVLINSNTKECCMFHIFDNCAIDFKLKEGVWLLLLTITINGFS